MGNQTEPTGRYGFFNLTGIEQHVFIVIIDFAMELFQQLLMVLEILRLITKPQLDPILIFDL